MIRVDYYDFGACRVKYFKTDKDVKSFYYYIKNYPIHFRFSVICIDFNSI